MIEFKHHQAVALGAAIVQLSGTFEAMNGQDGTSGDTCIQEDTRFPMSIGEQGDAGDGNDTAENSDGSGNITSVGDVGKGGSV